MRMMRKDEFEDQGEQDDATAIKHCLKYLRFESERLGLFETARVISAAINSLEPGKETLGPGLNS